jgi:DNA-binding CsgD family transcriptional regulator
VAVVERSAERRRDAARSLVAESAVELVLSTDCLRDAAGLRETPDVVMLGHCREHSAGCTARSELEARGCRVLRMVPGAPSPEAWAGRPTSDHATTERPRPPASPVARALHAVDAPPGTALRLSAQERRALALYIADRTLPQVASAMFVTGNTAATYLRRARAKLRQAGVDVDSKLALRDAALTLGIEPLDAP